MVLDANKTTFPLLSVPPINSPWSYLPGFMEAEVVYKQANGSEVSEIEKSRADGLIVRPKKGISIEVFPYLPVYFTTSFKDDSIREGSRTLRGLGLRILMGLKGNDHFRSFGYFWKDERFWENFYFLNDQKSYFERVYLRGHPERREREESWPFDGYPQVNRQIAPLVGMFLRDVKLIWPGTNLEGSLKKCLDQISIEEK